ncbi:unnamed protein product [Heterobilharzia americana]|nr:unnamed protein product [Heterobilharzia americana]
MNARKSLENEVKMKPITDAQEEALNYLRIWHHDYESWKFKTLQQSWLIKNALDKKMLPSSGFRIFKRYIEKLVGRAREDLLNRCSEVAGESVSEVSDGTEQCTKHTGDKMDSSPQHICQQKSESAISQKRAKKLLKILSRNAD